MRKLSLSILAASVALIPSAAFAQGGPPGPPPGHSWRGGGGMQGGGGMMMRHRGPMGGGQHFQRRLQRGFVIPPMWFGPQFHISNWQSYGFADPGPDGRWVRYYDDAYLIGRDGRIRDSREGLDWDEYGEEWDMADGVPAHRGGHGDRRDEEDYSWSERSESHGGHGGHGGRMVEGGHGGGYGSTQFYGGGYGYGMYAYPIVIETVTTTGGGYSEEIVEEYVEVRQRARRPRARARCVCQAPRPAPRRPAPRPRPPAGERG